ncbi:MAG: PaaI family thioesterase [Aquabacterium sp.]
MSVTPPPAPSPESLAAAARLGMPPLPTDLPTGPPDGQGWRHFITPPGFVEHNGPLWFRRDEQSMVMGLRVDARHVNPMGNLHGGMMATFADMLLPIAANSQGPLKGRFLPTVSLQIDFLAGVRLGAWIEGRAQVLRVTRSMVFMQGLVGVDGEPVARVSGVFKIGPEFKPRPPAPNAEPA